MSDKNIESRDFFDNNVKYWSSLFSDSKYTTAIQRIAKVSTDITSHHAALSTPEATWIDFGCGTGELLESSCNSTLKGIGFDISSNMISHCISNGTNPNITWQVGDLSKLKTISENTINYFSALGLIEYLDLDMVSEFLDSVSRMLCTNGFAYIGSRNRLFNVFSKNKFTDIKVELNCYDSLLDEINILESLIKSDSFIADLNEYVSSESLCSWKYPTSLPSTSPVSVSQRLQYSIFDFCARLQEYSLKVTDIYPIRFHPAKPCHFSNESTFIDDINNLLDGQLTSQYWSILQSSTLIFKVSL